MFSTSAMECIVDVPSTLSISSSSALSVSSQYWKEDIRRHLLEKFTQALTPEEAAPNFDLKASLLPIG